MGVEKHKLSITKTNIKAAADKKDWFRHEAEALSHLAEQGQLHSINLP